MKNRAIILLILLIGVSGMIFAQAADSLVSRANDAYSSGDYLKSIELYNKVISEGFESPDLYYNLGNAYFKSNDIPSAILYYEKARKLAPKDEDINFNLNLAKSRIIDKIEPIPEFFLKAWWKNLRHMFPIDVWARIGLGSFILLLVFASVFIISRSVTARKLSFWLGFIVLLIAIHSFLFSYQEYHNYVHNNEAIIFTPTVTVKSSPNENSVDLFVIHEGTKVSISDKVEGWTEIRIANGSVGWVKSDVYKTI